MRRLVPELALPIYSFVPRRFPHPFSDPAGHSHGVAPRSVELLDAATWSINRDYLFGFDLFNRGYYWESHEAWEGLWHANGRRGLVADFLKGLIKLAAAGVKVRENNERGVRDHAVRAIVLFERTASQAEVLLGMRPSDLAGHCRDILADPPTSGEDNLPVRIVFDFVLLPVMPGPSSPPTPTGKMT